MPKVIPVNKFIGFLSELVSLDGVTYRVETRWNGRMGAWLLNLYLSNGETLTLGRPIYTQQRLLGQIRVYDGMPADDILAYDITFRGNEVTEDNFGELCQLVYMGS